MNSDPWISEDQDSLPDFIIGGAMKSGTTTLRQILRQHPEIYIPNQEIGFFDIDNILEHGDFNFYDQQSGKWTYQNLKSNPAKYWEWYKSKFQEGESQIKGEDSTTYLASPIAAKRIGNQNKKIKMIFLLRHPTQRAISQYYHMLRTGRITYSLEETLRFNPNTILRRSLYKEHLENYFQHVSGDNILTLAFEQLIENPKSVVSAVCEFINADPDKIPEEAFITHANRSKYPKYIKRQLRKNRKLRDMGNRRYVADLPDRPISMSNHSSLYEVIYNKLHSKFNPLTIDKPNPPSHSTLEFLNTFFQTHLEGLDQLTGERFMSLWFNRD